MIDIKPISDKAHRIAVYAEFHQSDAQQLFAFAKERVAAGSGGHVLIDLTSLADFTLSAVSEELVHLPTFIKWIYALDRIAVIADEKWMRSAARLESALLPGVQYAVYDDDEADAAMAWVLEEADNPHTGAIHEIDIGKPGIAAYALSGRLDRAESERGIAMIRARFATSDCSRLMLVIRGWHGFDADTVFSTQVMAGKLELMKQLERYAIVGGPDWIKALAGFMDPLIKPELRCFALDEQDVAVEWLEGQKASFTAAP